MLLMAFECCAGNVVQATLQWKKLPGSMQSSAWTRTAQQDRGSKDRISNDLTSPGMWKHHLRMMRLLNPSTKSSWNFMNALVLKLGNKKQMNSNVNHYQLLQEFPGCQIMLGSLRPRILGPLLFLCRALLSWTIMFLENHPSKVCQIIRPHSLPSLLPSIFAPANFYLMGGEKL